MIGSGSSGNGYLIDDGHSMLAIECGVKFKDFCKKANFEISRLDGILISHEHRDHCRHVKQFLDTTFCDVYATAGTINAMQSDKALKITMLDYYRFKSLAFRRPVEIGHWAITAFETQHDAADPCGFLIDNDISGERILFATDSYYIKYRFKNITHLMIEANYSDEVVADKMSKGFDIKRKSRLIESHMSIDTALDFIKANKSDKLQEIHLLHLSDSNSIALEFKKKAQRIAGVPVYIA